jgi:hypothetical protein
MGESPLGDLAGDEAAFPVAFELFAAGPPEVSGKGGKLSGFESEALPESEPSRPGNAPLLPLSPLEGEPDDGGAAGAEPVKPPSGLGIIAGFGGAPDESVPAGRPGGIPGGDFADPVSNQLSLFVWLGSLWF